MECKYNLTVRSVELEVLPACERYGLGVIPYSPLAFGILGGALQKAERGTARGRRDDQEIERKRGQLGAYEMLCADPASPPGRVALAWLLANPAVTSPIAGPRMLESSTTRSPRSTFRCPRSPRRARPAVPGPGGPENHAFRVPWRSCGILRTVGAHTGLSNPFAGATKGRGTLNPESWWFSQ